MRRVWLVYLNSEGTYSTEKILSKKLLIVFRNILSERSNKADQEKSGIWGASWRNRARIISSVTWYRGN